MERKVYPKPLLHTIHRNRCYAMPASSAHLTSARVTFEYLEERDLLLVGEEEWKRSPWIEWKTGRRDEPETADLEEQPKPVKLAAKVQPIRQKRAKASRHTEVNSESVLFWDALTPGVVFKGTQLHQQGLARVVDTDLQTGELITGSRARVAGLFAAPLSWEVRPAPAEWATYATGELNVKSVLPSVEISLGGGIG